MRNLYLTTMLLMLAAVNYGQSIEYSASLSNYTIRTSLYFHNEKLEEYKSYTSLINMGLGYYFPLYTPTSEFAIGANGTIQAGVRIASNMYSEIFADFGLPVTAVIRYGAGSTREAILPVGIGLGAGYRLNAMLLPEGDPMGLNSDSEFGIYLRPYFFGEIVFDYQKRNKDFFDNFKIQYAIQPVYKKLFYGSGQEKDKDKRMYYYNLSLIKFLPID